MTTTMTVLTWDEMRTMPITAEDIARARAAGACVEAIDWAEAEPRTWDDVPPEWIGWYGASAATAEQLDACIEGTDAWGRGLIGRDRADLSAEQIDRCIEGTDELWRCDIGRDRAGLTPAQIDACIAGTTGCWRELIGRDRADLTAEQRAACDGV